MSTYRHTNLIGGVTVSLAHATLASLVVMVLLFAGVSELADRTGWVSPKGLSPA